MNSDVVVIGAGPYGLAVAAELRRRRIPFRIFGSPMETWDTRMPAAMYLKSEGFASNIATPKAAPTLADYCAATGAPYADVGLPVTRQVFTEYGRWVQSVVAPHLEDQRVISLRRERGGFQIDLERGEQVAAAEVVVATGLMNHAYVPPELDGVGAVSHSSDHRSFDDFEGSVVAVIGGGQSALETAGFLADAGAYPYLIARKSQIVWNPPPEQQSPSVTARVFRPRSGVGSGWRALAAERLPHAFRLLPVDRRLHLAFSTLGPAGAWWLHEQLEDRVPMLLGQQLIGAADRDGRLRLELRCGGDVSSLDVDHVIAATGYRYSLGHLSFVDAGLRGRVALFHGAPRLSTWFESSIPGLRFVGIAAAATFGPSMRFVCGTSVAGRRVSRAIAVSARPRPASRAPKARSSERLSKDDLIVLCYHGVSDVWHSHLAVRPASLAEQLKHLASLGYRSMGFTELVTERPGGRWVAITFDDAYASVLDHALPVLEASRMRATVFVPTRYAEEESCADWPGMEPWSGTSEAPHLRVLGWDGVRRLAAAGWEVGSHTHSHPRLRTLGLPDLDREFRLSKQMCEERLQRACHSIAYPYGSPGIDLDRTAVWAAAAAGYRAGAFVDHRLAPVEPLLWPRISVGRQDSLPTFKAKISPFTRRLRKLPGWSAIDAPRRVVRERVTPRA